MRKFSFFPALLCFFISLPAEAGVFELGTTFNFRSSKIDDDNYTRTKSVTGSISYYFWEMSALELSYTSGYSETSFKLNPTDPQYLLRQNFELVGLDFIFTMASRQSFLQPYIKIGAAYLKKKIIRDIINTNGSVDSGDISPDPSTVPSAGLGLKIAITEAFSIKAGVDAWPSDPKKGYKDLDYAARAGISWLF